MQTGCRFPQIGKCRRKKQKAGVKAGLPQLMVGVTQ
jgi:hypothetical protein